MPRDRAELEDRETAALIYCGILACMAGLTSTVPKEAWNEAWFVEEEYEVLEKFWWGGEEFRSRWPLNEGFWEVRRGIHHPDSPRNNHLITENVPENNDSLLQGPKVFWHCLRLSFWMPGQDPLMRICGPTTSYIMGAILLDSAGSMTRKRCRMCRTKKSNLLLFRSVGSEPDMQRYLGFECAWIYGGIYDQNLRSLQLELNYNRILEKESTGHCDWHSTESLQHQLCAHEP
ncbi:hypothetical protein IWX49DRAFT_632642 [Phyllosticta citricarpa]|uniref:Uncharacterized protein n=1 Tax=Phyllosticta citricarpa TaxID=55181 RepID=A0ABR1M4K9_9PEZI